MITPQELADKLSALRATAIDGGRVSAEHLHAYRLAFDRLTESIALLRTIPP